MAPPCKAKAGLLKFSCYNGNTMIESYSFGRMTVNGKPYSADLIIYPDGRLQDSWWRKQGHLLQLADMLDIIASKPDIIVTGTGAAGIMKPAAGLAENLEEQGIEFIAQRTDEAFKTFNQLVLQNKKVAGCFHLTC